MPVLDDGEIQNFRLAFRLERVDDRPVDPTTILVIREIHKASRDLGFPVLLVGATARIILLENVFGLNAGRATSDVASGSRISLKI